MWMWLVGLWFWVYDMVCELNEGLRVGYVSGVYEWGFLMFWEWNSGRSSEELHGIHHAKHTVHILARIQFLSRIVVILGPVGEPRGPLEWLGVVLESGRNFDGFWSDFRGIMDRRDGQIGW